MDAIKGSELQIPDAIFAWVLDGQGGVKPLADDDIIDKDKPCWLHLNPITYAMPWRGRAPGRG